MPQSIAGALVPDISGEKKGSGVTKPLKIRILQIAESWGGMEHNNTQLAVRLSYLGHRVIVTTIGAKAYSLMPDRYRGIFELEELPWNLDALPTFTQWHRLMRERPADIAILPKNWWAKGGVSLVWASGAVYPRVVLREHVAVPELPRPTNKRIGRLGLPILSLWWHKHIAYGRILSIPPRRIICVSDTVRNRLVEQCGFPADRTVVAYNGVDTELFEYDAVARSEFRQRHGISDQAIIVGSVGRFDNNTKRHDWSLRAFARLLEERPGSDLHFLLVGEGADRQALLDLAAELAIQRRVVLAPFSQSPWEAYSAIDIFAMPSAFEAFGLALVEAMACERCVVCTTVDGMSEILSEPDIGFGVGGDDFEGFARAMLKAHDLGPEDRRVMGRRARESVVRRFDADQQYAAIIRHVLGPD
jgi:L-malate glycosyltransferase